MKHIKLLAYTILEMVIAMLITAIVIGMAWSVFSIVMRAFGAFEKKHEHTEELVRLNTLLNRDFHKADIILRDSGGIRLLTDSATVRYELDSSFVLRHSRIIDTFNITLTEPIYTLEGQAISEKTDGDDEDKRIDHFGLTLHADGRSILYFYDKPYSSQDLFNRVTDANH
ncbi:hypothetical protein IM792_16130 [Mucilaginibacter sp. JRF]|uniref:PulJ/GspJ family protein n=1 Tax=Mucilaginibacter sp. JRF TaxID=2780088 RepID=UPI0018815D01|nr:hypothetical protein [Mucilaginibacter sp. JRF]MBE9585983.1 hypothetical protein [Mucilaginibacter sp. JRF]